MVVVNVLLRVVVEEREKRVIEKGEIFSGFFFFVWQLVCMIL